MPWSHFFLLFWKPFCANRAERTRLCAIQRAGESAQCLVFNTAPEKPKKSTQLYLTSDIYSPSHQGPNHRTNHRTNYRTNHRINHGPDHIANQARDLFSIDLPSFLAPLYSFEYDDVEDWSHSFSNHSFEYDSFEYDYSDFSRTSPSFIPLPPYLPNSGILTATSVAIPKGGPLFQTLELGQSQEPVHSQSPSFFPINRNLEASSGVICSLPAQRQSSLADNGQNQISQDLVHNDGTTGSGEASSSSSYSVHQPNINAPHSAALEPVNYTQESPVTDDSLEAPRNPKRSRRRRKSLHFSCGFCSETFTRRCELK